MPSLCFSLLLATEPGNSVRLDMVFDAIKSLGVPIVFATVLLIFFLRIVRRLTDHNEQLLSEVAALRQQIDTAVNSLEINDRLLTQNERLVTAIRTKEEAFIELLRSVATASNNQRDQNDGKKTP